MALTTNLKVSKLLSEMIEKLAKNKRKSVEDYLFDLIREKYEKLK